MELTTEQSDAIEAWQDAVRKRESTKEATERSMIAWKNAEADEDNARAAVDFAHRQMINGLAPNK